MKQALLLTVVAGCGLMFSGGIAMFAAIALDVSSGYNSRFGPWVTRLMAIAMIGGAVAITGLTGLMVLAVCPA